MKSNDFYVFLIPQGQPWSSDLGPAWAWPDQPSARRARVRAEASYLLLLLLLLPLSRGGGNQVVVRALELVLCRLRVTLQGYPFQYLACLQEPSKTHSKPIL